MSYIQPKTDYKDGDILYGIDLNASNAVIKAGVDDNFDRIQGLDADKQDKLTAGTGIDITDNVISNTNTIANWGDIEGNIEDQADLKNALDSKQDLIDSSNKLDYSLLDNTPTIPSKTSDLTNDSGFIDNTYHDSSKQDTLTAGTGIQIENNIISNTQTSAEWGNITGTLSDQTDLNNALGGKQATLISGTNIKTVNNYSLLGSGNIDISGGGGSNNQVYYVPLNDVNNPFILENAEPGLYQFGDYSGSTGEHANIHNIKVKAFSTSTGTTGINTTDGKILIVRRINPSTEDNTPVGFYTSGEFRGIKCFGVSIGGSYGEITHLMSYDIANIKDVVYEEFDQTITGVKTFSVSPKVPSPSTYSDAVNKNYLDTQLDNKVSKVTGKDLSTNDYTTEDKTKLGTIEEGAQVNVDEILIGDPSSATEDTKLVIESTDLDFQGLEIANEYITGDNVAYSADYVNKITKYSTTETVVGYNDSGKPIYRKLFKGSIAHNTTIVTNVEEYYGVKGYAVVISGTGSSMPYYEYSASGAYMATVNFLVNSNSLRFIALNNGNSITANVNFYVEYTKTTD